MKAIIAQIAFLLFLFYLPLTKPVFAVTVTITNSPSTVTSDSFTVNVSVLGASSGTNYIRIDLYKDGTSNYFGETYNGSDWYSGSDGKQYFPITIINSKSTASASLQARIGIPNSSDYDGQGFYKMRIRRYTSSGGPGSEDANNSAVAVSISMPTPTPISTDSPTPTQVSTDPPAPTKTPTPVPTKSPTPKPLTPIPSIALNNGSSGEAVLSESSESSSMSSEDNSSALQNPNKT